MNPRSAAINNIAIVVLVIHNLNKLDNYRLSSKSWWHWLCKIKPSKHRNQTYNRIWTWHRTLSRTLICSSQGNWTNNKFQCRYLHHILITQCPNHTTIHHHMLCHTLNLNNKCLIYHHFLLILLWWTILQTVLGELIEIQLIRGKKNHQWDMKDRHSNRKVKETFNTRYNPKTQTDKLRSQWFLNIIKEIIFLRIITIKRNQSIQSWMTENQMKKIVITLLTPKKAIYKKITQSLPNNTNRLNSKVKNNIRKTMIETAYNKKWKKLQLLFKRHLEVLNVNRWWGIY